MSICYYCDEALNEMNRSKEHVIPECIGGILTCSTLLCSQCNRRLGHTVDAAFSKDIQSFLVLADKKRTKRYIDLGNNLVLDTNARVKFKSPVVKHERIGENQIHLNIQANNQAEARKILKNLKLKKYPKLDIDKILESMTVSSEQTEYVEIPINVSSLDILNEITKIAINFYLERGYGKSLIDTAIESLRTGDSSKVSKAFYLNNAVVFNSDRACAHHVLLLGNRVEKILVAYVELYSCLKYVVLLNDEYEGQDITESYSLDLKTKQEFETQYHFALERKRLLSKFYSENDDHFDEASSLCVRQLSNMVGVKKFHDELNDKMKLIFDDIFARKEELGIEYVEDLFPYVWPQMEKMLLPYIRSASESRLKELEDSKIWKEDR